MWIAMLDVDRYFFQYTLVHQYVQLKVLDRLCICTSSLYCYLFRMVLDYSKVFHWYDSARTTINQCYIAKFFLWCCVHWLTLWNEWQLLCLYYVTMPTSQYTVGNSTIACVLTYKYITRLVNLMDNYTLFSTIMMFSIVAVSIQLCLVRWYQISVSLVT